ncbi:MAG TPA: histidine phosphatase family protein [Bacteroidales bacterium]|nr:histidine phosphatase family protein [Bacteroidales bacterium]
MTKILLIRHGMTNSVGKRLSGRHPDVHLNEEGRLQAEMLAQRLSHINIHAIYSSPLERALETAKPLGAVHNLMIIPNENFLEINVGNWTNKTFDEIKTDPVFKRFNSFRSTTRIPGGEMMPEAQLRIIAGIEQLRTVHPSETIVIVSHSDLIKAAIAYYAGIHLDMFQRLEIFPASVSIVEVFEDTARILGLNDTGEINV